jgi:oligoendopeptidase F
VLLYPFYVQSYCTSILPSLELYFMEIANEGAGFSAYKHLVAREENEKFPRALERSGLTSPFTEDYVERICNEIHYLLCGTYYFTEMSNDQNAA